MHKIIVEISYKDEEALREAVAGLCEAVDWNSDWDFDSYAENDEGEEELEYSRKVTFENEEEEND